MRKFVVAAILFVFPTWLSRQILRILYPNSVKIGNGAKIGFSIILSDNIQIGGGKIGHFNLIKVNHFKLGEHVLIKHLNLIRGNFSFVMDDNAYINHTNKISTPSKLSVGEVEFHMKEHSHVTVNHIIDMTDSVIIGKGTWIAGCETHLWTHSFFLSKTKYESKKMSAPIIIGNHVYIGARCSIMPGVNISDAITIGAQTCISKSLNKQGLYVSQPVRYLSFDPDDKIYH